MTELTCLLPAKANTVQALVFHILKRESPLRIIQLTNYIKRRYGRSVTFQAVRKVVLQLTEQEVLLRKDQQFSINPDWVLSVKKDVDKLYFDVMHRKNQPAAVSAIEEDANVFLFSTLNAMIHFWHDAMDAWFTNFKKGDLHINCYQILHQWEGLLHLNKEREILKPLKEKGIVSYQLINGNTPLDKQIAAFYNSIGVKTVNKPSRSEFDRTHAVGTYGELIIQVEYPEALMRRIENVFKKSTSIDSFNLHELAEIAETKTEVRLTVMKNAEMAKHINRSIISQIE